MQYTYLNGNNVYIYPSANAEDGGNINKEVNIAGLVTSVVPKDYIVSYKLRDPSVAHESLEVDLAAGLSPTEFNLYSGQVVLNGRSVELSFDPDGTNCQTFDLSTLYDGTIGTASALYLLVVPFFAASGNILGDSYQNVGGVVTRECRGVALTAVSSLTGLGLDHYVVVGKFTLVSGSITRYTVDSDSYRPIDLSSINPYVDSNTSGSTANKEVVGLPDRLTDPFMMQGWQNQVAYVEFSASNTATSPTINNLTIKLLDGRVCPWYAISEANKVYQLKFVYDSTTYTDSYWILLNPSAPVVKCQYIYDNSGTPDTSCKLTMYWKEIYGQVSGVIYTPDAGVSTLPVGKYNIDDTTQAPPISIPGYPKGSTQIAVYCDTYALYLSGGYWLYLPQVVPAGTIDYTLPGEATTRHAHRQFAFKYMIS